MDNKKILVVDDEADMRIFVSTVVETRGFKPMTAQDGTEALRLARSDPPALVILDVIMPDLDGIEICLRIRQWSQAPIMMLSAWGAGEDEVRGLDLSAESYLTEPFGVAEFKARLREALERDSTAVTPLVSLGLPSIEMN